MYKGTKAYLFKGETVVLNKKDINNAKDEEFKEVVLYIPYRFIQESAKELEYILDED